MFMNEYSHSIDAKGRMILPARFREELGENFILSRGLDECLVIYPADRWESMTDKLRKLPSTKKAVRELRRFLIGQSMEVECDRQGRILIPANLQAYAKLTKEAKIIGVGDTIEIWNPEIHESLEDSGEDMSDLAESLDLPLDFNL